MRREVVTFLVSVIGTLILFSVMSIYAVDDSVLQSPPGAKDAEVQYIGTQGEFLSVSEPFTGTVRGGKEEWGEKQPDDCRVFNPPTIKPPQLWCYGPAPTPNNCEGTVISASVSAGPVAATEGCASGIASACTQASLEATSLAASFCPSSCSPSTSYASSQGECAQTSEGSFATCFATAQATCN